MSAPPATLHELPTPALVLDASRLARNAGRMRERAAALGVALRPHVKTVKSVEPIRIALGRGRGPITVSTLAEAEHFAQAGFADMVLAVCAVPERVPRAAALSRQGVRLGLIADDAEVVAALDRATARLGATLDAYVEIDVGEHRTGVDPRGETLLDVARAIHDSAALLLRGVLCHAGQSYACRTPEALASVAEDERRLAALAAQRLREADLPCAVVSAGSTPTASHLASGAGLTELRPGVYLLMDAFQAAIGVCALDDIAASVLSTVIARHDGGRRLVLDAGALALSKDRSTAATGRDAGYGLLADVHGRPLPGARVADVHQEHGEVRSEAPLDLRVGDRVRVLPNHACITAAAHDRFHVVEDGAPTIVDVWPRVAGW